jgi:heterotetrameric sarcosine oxidase gamma subunit
MKEDSLTAASPNLFEDPWQNLIDAPRTSALGQVNLKTVSHESKTIHLKELTGTALLRIHSLRSCMQLNTTLNEYDFTLPENVNQSLGQDPVAICVAPGNWLLFSAFLDSNRLYRQLRTILGDDQTSVLNFTAGLTTFRLSGDGVMWLMSKLCGMDFLANTNLQAHAARTRIQQAAVILHYYQPGSKGGEFVLDIIVERSIARYLWHILLDAIPHAEELQEIYG